MRRVACIGVVWLAACVSPDAPTKPERQAEAAPPPQLESAVLQVWRVERGESWSVVTWRLSNLSDDVYGCRGIARAEDTAVGTIAWPELRFRQPDGMWCGQTARPMCGMGGYTEPFDVAPGQAALVDQLVDHSERRDFEVVFPVVVRGVVHEVRSVAISPASLPALSARLR